MKKIYFVRHAKSDRQYLSLADIDRPLNERGYRDAYAMSKRIMDQHSLPDELISSTAVRAVSTALIFMRTFNFTAHRLSLNPLFYEEDETIYISQLKSLNDNIHSVMLFAHNPTITMVANLLSDKPINDFPTCAVAEIEFNSRNWEEIDQERGTLRSFIFPKDSL